MKRLASPISILVFLGPQYFLNCLLHLNLIAGSKLLAAEVEHFLQSILISSIQPSKSTWACNMTSHTNRHDYTIGWICALPIEYAAAQEMLDERHPCPDIPHKFTMYTVGRIGVQYVVLGCLPPGQMGTIPATAVVTHMKRMFPAVQCALMVGIGGGVPSQCTDIRLGDIVVSYPANGHNGVVQYDWGRVTPNGFQRTGILASPPDILLQALATLRHNQDRGENSLMPHLSRLNRSLIFNRPRAETDVLFEADYPHPRRDVDCVSCTPERQIRRTRRTNTSPVAHYGTIASGNAVMRDGVTRDRISSDLKGALCFEMEAAGLMNNFPCLVIRGICDYADSHKNKAWQPYAAATAAAYAKELLLVMRAVH